MQNVNAYIREPQVRYNYTISGMFLEKWYNVVMWKERVMQISQHEQPKANHDDYLSLP